ncbi:MAG: acyl-CoA thioesterase [Lentisphaeria bacterium]|nr:acyl-CoA thioesterase [Lentisphaeria bacterium]
MEEQELELRIDWSHLDLLGHVNNLAIVGYFQAARVMLSEKVGLPVFPGMRVGPIEAATEIQFTKQLHYPGHVRVCTSVAEIKQTSFILSHRIYDDAGDLAARGREVIVCFDFVRQVKIPLPEPVRAALSGYLPSSENSSGPR